MRSVSGREFARMLEQRGWALLRINGNAALKPGLLRHLAKLAQIPDEELR